MRKLILRMNISVDGVAAGENGEPVHGVDLNDPDSWRTIFASLETVDGLLIGGAAHEEYLNYWRDVLTKPDADPNELKFAEFATRTQHYIVSRTLKTSKWPNARVLTGGVDEIAALKNQRGGDLLMWGGPTSAGAAIQAGFVDELHLEKHLVIAGRGKKLFANVDASQRLRHLSTEVYASGVVLDKHARA